MTDTAPAAAPSDATTTAAFSLELSEDQRDVRDWVHGFAEGVVRPAAAEWDEREETPVARDPGGREDRPLRLRGPGPVLRRPDRADAADRQRGALLGRRRHRHGDHGHLARGGRRSSARAPASRSASGSRSASARPTSRRSAAFCVSEPNAGSDVSSLRTRARFDEATDEWVLNGQKAWATNGGIANVHVIVASVDPRARRPRPGRVHRAARHEGPRDGHEGQEARPARLAHRRRLPRRLPRSRPANVLGGKEKLDERLARAREGTQRPQPGRDGDLRGQPPDRRRPGDRDRARRLRVRARVRQATASSSGARSSTTRRSRSRSPT